MKNHLLTTLTLAFISACLGSSLQAAVIVDTAASLTSPASSSSNLSAINDNLGSGIIDIFRRVSAASVGTVTYTPTEQSITDVTVRLVLHDSIYNNGGFNTAMSAGNILGFTNGVTSTPIAVSGFSNNGDIGSGWRTYNITANGFSTSSLVLRLNNPFDTGANPWKSNIDQATLTTVPVPEPETYILLILGGLGLFALRRPGAPVHRL